MTATEHRVSKRERRMDDPRVLGYWRDWLYVLGQMGSVVPMDFAEYVAARVRYEQPATGIAGHTNTPFVAEYGRARTTSP